MEALEIVLLVRAVDAVILEAKARQHHVHAQRLFELMGHGNGAAAADEDRGLAPFGRQRVARLAEGRSLDREADRLTRAMLQEFHAAIGRDACMHMLPEGVADGMGS